jgi:hypothetical protein
VRLQLFILLASIRTSSPKLLAVLWTFFLPVTNLLFLVGFCILLDTVFGLWKAKKLKEKISSRRLSAIISKMFLYQVTVILFYLIDKFILNAIMLTFFSVPLMLTKVIALILISIEIFSIDESYRAVHTYGLWHAFKRAVGRAKEIKTDIDGLKD